MRDGGTIRNNEADARTAMRCWKVERKERRYAHTLLRTTAGTSGTQQFEVATYSTVIKKSGQVINAYYVASLTVICLKQYNVGYEERAAHFGPRDLIKLTWSRIIAPLLRGLTTLLTGNAK